MVNIMKRILICIILIGMMLCGCQNNNELEHEKNNLQRDIIELEEEISNLKEERDYLQEFLTETREENDIKRYIVTFEIGQSHFTLDIGTHLKDSMNKLEFSVLVSKEYYDSVDIGTVVNDDFRVGSFLMKGSIGSWDIEVVDKRIEQ